MKKLFLALAIIFPVSAHADKERCITITSSIGFTSILESSDYCKFNKQLPERLAVEYRANDCDNLLTDEDRQAIAAIIATDTARGFARFGKKEMCKVVKTSYDTLDEALK